MRLATFNPLSQKEHTEIYKILNFGVNRASFDIQKFKNVKFTKKCLVIPDTASALPYISL